MPPVLPAVAPSVTAPRPLALVLLPILALAVGAAVARPDASRTEPDVPAPPPGRAAGARIAAAPAGVPPEACDAPEHRQFDFWVGEWRVLNADGDEVGRSTIRPVAGGCGLLEEWRAGDGGTGTSLNFADPESGRWTQHWVGSAGMVLHLEGELRDGRMVLEGTRTRDGEPLRDRISWEPRPDGRVVQTWSTSGDGGESWEVAWEGRYVPVED